MPRTWDRPRFAPWLLRESSGERKTHESPLPANVVRLSSRRANGCPIVLTGLCAGPLQPIPAAFVTEARGRQLQRLIGQLPRLAQCSRRGSEWPEVKLADALDQHEGNIMIGCVEDSMRLSVACLKHLASLDDSGG